MPLKVISESGEGGTGGAEVVIVGAGPAGLLLAGDLATRGVACTVLERRAGRADASTTRAFAVHARTLEQLDARGLADRLVSTGTTVGGLTLYGRAEIKFTGLPGRFPFLLVTPQHRLERLLEERAVAAGARIVRGVRVVGVSQDADGVSIRTVTETASSRADGATAPAGTGDSIFRARYAVGADGVHSTVREALGVPFPGRMVVRSLMLADVRFTEPPQDVLTVNGVGDAFAFIAPFGDGWYRVFCWDREHQTLDDAPVDVSEIRSVLVRVFKTDFGLTETRWLSRFHSDERQAPRYRIGRILLAGDAAHCHSPAGGQGMNTGLQDAANLGWKLAAVLRGQASDPEWLLDSYQGERHPVGSAVLRSSGVLLRLALIKPWPLRVARNVLSVMALRIPLIARAAMNDVSGIGIDYGGPRGAHPSVGRRAADLLLTDDKAKLADGDGEAGAAPRLYELLRDGRFVLVGRSGDDTGISDGWKGEVDYATSAQAPCALMLIRPDGYVAWATDEADLVMRASAAREALTQWCGPAID